MVLPDLNSSPLNTSSTPARLPTAPINRPPSRTPTPGSPGGLPRAMSMAGSENYGSGSHLRGHSQSPRLSITNSLQAAAAVNAGLRQEEDSRRNSIGSGSISSLSRERSVPHSTQRRRSTVLMNLQLNDPSVPSPGEMVAESPTHSFQLASPRSITHSPSMVPHSMHMRNPSLGEIHQELEQEQEAQVNRLLQMVRIQQEQLQAIQAAAGTCPTSSSAIDDFEPHHSTTFPIAGSPNAIQTRTSLNHPRSSFDVARTDLSRRSRTPSRNASPSAHMHTPPTIVSSTTLPTSALASVEDLLGGSAYSPSGVSTRDEAHFYQAETQMMVRENQMLRLRIRELERQVAENRSTGEGGHGHTHEPATPSGLMWEQRGSEDGSAREGDSPRGTHVET